MNPYRKPRNLILWLIVLQGCKTPDELLKIPTNADNILLRSTGDRYIFLGKDSAFDERRIFDKPSFFTDFDTLLYDKVCNCFLGKVMTLHFKDGIGNLTYSGGRYAGKSAMFSLSSETQLKTWHGYKNIDSYSKCSYDILNIIKHDSKLYDSARADFRNVISLSNILDQRSFSIELEKFKTKYSLACTLTAMDMRRLP